MHYLSTCNNSLITNRISVSTPSYTMPNCQILRPGFKANLVGFIEAFVVVFCYFDVVHSLHNFQYITIHLLPVTTPYTTPIFNMAFGQG